MILFKEHFAIDKTSQSCIIALVMTINTFNLRSIPLDAV